MNTAKVMMMMLRSTSSDADDIFTVCGVVRPCFTSVLLAFSELSVRALRDIASRLTTEIKCWVMKMMVMNYTSYKLCIRPDTNRIECV